MNERGSIGRPVIIIIMAALVSMSVVSSFLIFTAQQTTQAKIELLVAQNVRNEIVEDVRNLANDIETNLSTIRRTLSALGQNELLAFDQQVRSSLFELAEFPLQGYTDTIMWIGANGTLLYTSNDHLNRIGADLSKERFFELSVITDRPLVDKVLGSDGKVGFVVVSVPISRQGAFAGVMAAYIPTGLLESSLLTDVRFAEDTQLILIANDGTILSHHSESLVGGNVFDENFEASFGDESREIVMSSFKLMTEGKSGTFEYAEAGGEMGIMAYEPVLLDGRHVWTVALSSPLSVEASFSGALEEQRNFTIIAAGFIGAVSAIFIAVILILNRRLLHTVTQQDVKIRDQLAELQHANEKLLQQESVIRGQLAEIQAAYERLKEQDVIKDEFINIAAHELRTPVLPIILSAENLADRMPDDNNIQIILRNAKRITKLTNDILDVSRIESNTFKLQKQKTEIAKLVEEIIQDALLRIPKGQDLKIVFKSEIPDSMQELSIDRGRITQVLGNLIDNAINFTDSGVITVRLEPADGLGSVRMKVTDTGKGIDHTIKDKLFGKFVSKSEKAKGTGLGLYLCKAIVEAHGGKIVAENNRNGKGATFSFTLPTS